MVVQEIGDYLGMHQEPVKADVLEGFGNFNTEIARRAAERYHQGYAPKILFTSGLGVHQLFLERRIVAAMGFDQQLAK